MWKFRASLLILALLYSVNRIDGTTTDPSLKYVCLDDTDCNAITDACQTDGTCSDASCNGYDCTATMATDTSACASDDGCTTANTFYCPDNVAANCECNEGWITYAAAGILGCNQQRLEVKCYSDGITLNLFSYFTPASVRILNPADNTHTACVMAAPDADGKIVYDDGVNRLLFDSSSTAPCNIPVAADSGADKIIKLYIQRQALYRTDVDYLAEITCTPPAAGDPYTLASVVHTAVEPAPAAVAITALFDAGFEMLLAAPTALTAPIATTLLAGDPLVVVINSPYVVADGASNMISDHFVQIMSIANYNLDPEATDPGDGTKLDIVTDYCIQERGIITEILKLETTDANSAEVLQTQIHINVPYITAAAATGFSAGDTFLSVTVCINTCTAANAAACTYPWSTAVPSLLTAHTPSSGRRKRDSNLIDQREKRQAEDDLPADVTGVLRFRVQDPRAPAIVVQTGSNDSQQDNCHQTMMFILPLALMGCLLLLSLVLLCFFYSKLRVMMGEQKHGSTNMAYKS